MYLCLSQRNFLYIVIVSMSINSILSVKLSIFYLLCFAIMIEIKCYEVTGMCSFILFFLTVKCQCKFYSKLNFPKQMSGDFLGTQAFTILEHLMI